MRAGARSGRWQGKEHLGSDIPPLEARVRDDEGKRSEAVERVGAGEHRVEEDAGMTSIGIVCSPWLGSVVFISLFQPRFPLRRSEKDPSSRGHPVQRIPKSSLMMNLFRG